VRRRIGLDGNVCRHARGDNGWSICHPLQVLLRAGAAHGSAVLALSAQHQTGALFRGIELRFDAIAIECVRLKETPLSHIIPTMRVPIDVTDSFHELQAIKRASNAFAI
jgi:hypothetical protein